MFAVAQIPHLFNVGTPQGVALACKLNVAVVIERMVWVDFIFGHHWSTVYEECTNGNSAEDQEVEICSIIPIAIMHWKDNG